MNKYKVLTISFITIVGLLIATQSVDATSWIPYPRPVNVSQTITTREPSSSDGQYFCNDEVQIVDRELPHGEQINAYPKTICHHK